MIVKEIEKNFYKYMFEPRKDNRYGYNIFVLIGGDKALLIDAGYKIHSAQIKNELKSKGIEIEKVIISHFHLDHINGLNELPGAEIIGSVDYEKTLDIYIDAEFHHLYTPSVKIDKEYECKFGTFDIKIKKFPGHASCSIITVINDKYVHVGDELMFSNDGIPVLPLIGRNQIQRHIDSLEKLKEYVKYIILPSHGKAIMDEKVLSKDINNRLKYLKAVALKVEKISYEEAVRECDEEFLHSEWHDTIYQ
jgi:glyoxylase-like metal-dependent hydrolase (beta-lactamase superfamily II)